MAHYEDITIDQGSDVSLELHLVDTQGDKKNLVGYSAAAKMKVNYNSDSADTVTFDTYIAAPATDGIVVLNLTNAQTDLLNPRKKYVYDVEVSHLDSDSNTIIERVLQGTITVTPSVTK